MRVLSVDDLGYSDKGGNLFLVYQQQKENMASKGPVGSLNSMGLGGI